jgi:hypothetical protein
MIQFNKTPKRLLNYEDLIIETYDPGWLLVPFHNMVKDSKAFRFRPWLKRNNDYKYTAVDDYYRSDLMSGDVPFHYFVEKVGEEWDIHLGTPLINRSWWVRDMIDAKVLHAQFRNVKVVAIADSFYDNIPEERMFRKLWHVLFSGWVRTSKLDKRFIRFFDEVADWDAYNEAKAKGTIDYTLTKSTYWNRQVFERMQMYYKKF